MFWFAHANLNFEDVLMRILASVIIVFLILPFHEFAHAWVAYKLGDKTAKYDKRLTLNPIEHFDPLGAVCLLFFNFGWAKPVPVDARNFKNPRRDMALTSLAGPVSNLLAAILGGLLFNLIILLGFPYFGYSLKWIFKFLSYYISINVGLAVFNMLPIPPLDGFGIIECIIPKKYMFKYHKHRNIITIVLIAMLFLRFFDIPLNFLQNIVFNAVVNITSIPFLFFK